MKKNIINKLLMMILIIFCIFSLLTSQVYADSLGDIFTKADDFVTTGQAGSAGTTISDDAMKNMSNILYNTLLVIAVVVAVIWGMVIGIHYMTGSVGEKAKVKETLIPYIAGCIVVFGAFVIWKLVVTILQSSPSA